MKGQQAWHPSEGGAGVVCALCGGPVPAGGGAKHGGRVYCYPACWVAVGQADLRRKR